MADIITSRQVFWLSDHPKGCAFPPDSLRQWHNIAAFVPEHSGGTAPDFYGIPF